MPSTDAPLSAEQTRESRADEGKASCYLSGPGEENTILYSCVVNIWFIEVQCYRAEAAAMKMD